MHSAGLWGAQEDTQTPKSSFQLQSPAAGDDLAGFLRIARPVQLPSTEAPTQELEQRESFARKLTEEEEPVAK